MKPIFFVSLLAVLVTSAGCYTVEPAVRPDRLSQVTLITVEYNNERSLQQTVMQILRSVRISEWETREYEDSKFTKARYESLSAATAEEIEEQLSQLPGVRHVEIKRDGIPVTNDVYHPFIPG
jgi:hypothetical protein